MSDPQEDVILKELIRERDAFAVFSREKLEQMDSGIKARMQTIEGLSFKGAGALSVGVHAENSSSDQVDEVFASMSYPVMVHHVLSLQAERCPLTASEILDVMNKHGVDPEAHDPRNTVKTALNRRKEKVGDIVHTGLGEWGLVSWYSESELEKFSRGLDGSNGRDAKRHVQKTKDGIAALKARGVHYGRAPKITEEMWDLAVRLYADEDRPTSYVYQRLLELTPEGQEPIVKSSFSNRKQQFMAREPYPAKWKAYFDQRQVERQAKESVASSDTELRLIK